MDQHPPFHTPHSFPQEGQAWLLIHQVHPCRLLQEALPGGWPPLLCPLHMLPPHHCSRGLPKAALGLHVEMHS